MNSSTHDISESKVNITTEAAVNETVSLSCHARSQRSLHLWDGNSDLQVEWFVKGMPVEMALSQSQAAVVFSELANTLTITAEDPWELIGTVQCFVSIIVSAGAQPSQVLSADVHLLSRGD